MKIYHFCQYKVRHSNGVQSAVWELAKAQSALGEDVEIVSLGRAPSQEEVAHCRAHGVGLRGVSGGLPRPWVLWDLTKEIRGAGPAVCHFHSVFVVWHSLLALLLRWAGLPYFISPHGNLAPRELARKSWRKWLYLRVIELGALSACTGCLCASIPERRNVDDLTGESRPASLVAGNGVDRERRVGEAETPRPKGRRRKGLFLGKSDVVNKGFDRMFALAKIFPDGIDFLVIKHNQQALVEEFDALVRQYADDPKVRVHGPAYGAEKYNAFEAAGCYVHLARWEVFGMSIVEAAMHGLPLVLAGEIDIAEEARAAGAAYLVESYDDESIARLKALLEDDEALDRMGENAREWATSRYTSAAVATRTIEFYRKCLEPS